MGWCSGTEVFDKVVRGVIAMDAPTLQKVRITRAVIQVLRNMDWDCEGDIEDDLQKHPVVKQAFRLEDSR